ncbi:MAG TPA: hypothetical protein VKV74_12355 [Bryobacteraceae bacterium]|nr:hypothetical protein [Bryobacteraceae bacterium]
MRLLSIASFAAFLAGCGSAPGPQERDETRQPWYSQAVEQLAALNAQAEGFFKRGESDQAAELIKEAQPVQRRLLSVRSPTLEAMEAVSDLDDLYGRMLLSNRHYGWARLFFQKNLARWKHWSPQTEETARRLKKTEAEIAACDQRLGE